MTGPTEQALHTPITLTPIHDELVERYANLIQSSENIGHLKERIDLVQYLDEMNKQPQWDKQTINHIIKWIEARNV